MCHLSPTFVYKDVFFSNKVLVKYFDRVDKRYNYKSMARDLEHHPFSYDILFQVQVIARLVWEINNNNLWSTLVGAKLLCGTWTNKKLHYSKIFKRLLFRNFCKKTLSSKWKQKGHRNWLTLESILHLSHKSVLAFLWPSPLLLWILGSPHNVFHCDQIKDVQIEKLIFEKYKLDIFATSFFQKGPASLINQHGN